VFDLEPRYAGKSYPVPDVSTRDLRYYSIEQKYLRSLQHSKHFWCKSDPNQPGATPSVADVVNFIQDKSTLLPNNVRSRVYS
jgi:hypothetical protein